MTWRVEKLREKRLKRGLSQSALAKLIKKSPATIHLIESGKIGGLPGTIKAIADVLEIPMEELLVPDDKA